MRGTLIALIVATAFALAGGASSATRAAPTDSFEIAFARGGTIYVGRTDGTQIRPIGRGFTPQWSPDGQRLVFVRQVGGNSDIYVADADGSNVRRLTKTPGGDLTPSWSPDGTRIAFASNRHGLYRIYVMRADGTRIRLLPLRGATSGESFLPAWSPDGRLVAFSTTAWTPENPEIYVVRPDGKNLRRLTRTKGNVEVLGDDSWPRWSPDSRRIAFSSNRTGDGEIWIMRSDGRGQKRIAGLPRRDDWSPSFSPDGRWIVFHSLGAGPGTSQLYLVRPDGSGLTRLGIRGEDAVFRP